MSLDGTDPQGLSSPVQEYPPCIGQPQNSNFCSCNSFKECDVKDSGDR